MRVVCVVSVAAVLTVMGCSGEPVPPPADLSGTWDFSYVTTSGAGATCLGTMTFTISQTDQTFVGFQRGSGTLVCDGISLNLPNPNLADPTAFDGEMISSGIVSPSEVAFQLNTLQSHDAGTVERNGVMTGTASWVIPVKPRGTIAVTGTWTAVKQRQQ
jgi:hypothetical protein